MITGDRADSWTAAGWISVVRMTCCILVGLVLVWWKVGRVADTVSNGTQTLEEGERVQDISTRVMITKHGKSAQRRSDCPSFFFENTRDPISVLVFSLRFKRRFAKARLEAAQWVMRTSFEPQSICESLQAPRLLFHSCTPDIPVALTHDSDAPFNVTHAVSLPWMAPGLRQATAPLVHGKCGFCTSVSLGGSFAWCKSSLH